MLKQLIILTVLTALVISSCTSAKKMDKIQPEPNVKASSVSSKTTATQTKQTKDHMTVSLYTGKQKPEKPYVVIGKETVSKYNLVGIKRQQANIRDVMRHLAATLGGDAVIDITSTDEDFTGTVISYKQPDLISIKNKA